MKRANVNGNICKIISENEESANEARKILEMEKQVMDVPYYVRIDLISNRAQKAREFERQSGVALITNETFYYERMYVQLGNNK